MSMTTTQAYILAILSLAFALASLYGLRGNGRVPRSIKAMFLTCGFSFGMLSGMLWSFAHGVMIMDTDIWLLVGAFGLTATARVVSAIVFVDVLMRNGHGEEVD